MKERINQFRINYKSRKNYTVTLASESSSLFELSIESHKRDIIELESSLKEDALSIKTCRTTPIILFRRMMIDFEVN